MFDLAVAQPTIERLGAGVVGAYFQVDDRDTTGAGHLLLPLNQTPPYPQPAGSGLYRKQVQMGPLGIKLHNGEANQPARVPGREDIAVVPTNMRGDPTRSPRPRQPVLNQVTRHERDTLRIAQPREFQFSVAMDLIVEESPWIMIPNNLLSSGLAAFYALAQRRQLSPATLTPQLSFSPFAYTPGILWYDTDDFRTSDTLGR